MTHKYETAMAGLLLSLVVVSTATSECQCSVWSEARGRLVCIGSWAVAKCPEDNCLKGCTDGFPEFRAATTKGSGCVSSSSTSSHTKTSSTTKSSTKSPTESSTESHSRSHRKTGGHGHWVGTAVVVTVVVVLCAAGTAGAAGLGWVVFSKVRKSRGAPGPRTPLIA